MSTRTPLGARAAALGARLGRRGDRPAVLDFGDPAREAHALEHGVGVVPRLGRAVLAVAGRDRVDWLHRLLTQDVKGLAEDGAARACLLTPQARVLGDLLVLRRPDVVLLDLDARALGAVASALDRYVLADDVVLEDRSAGLARVGIRGPRATEALTAAGVAVPAPGHVAGLRLGEVPVELAVLAGPDGARCEVLAPAARGGDVLDGLAAVPGVVLAGEDAEDTRRVALLEAAFGAELDDRVMPLEARLDDVAISWRKGCYPGQEPVVKARHRGRPPNLLVRLRLLGADPVGPDEVLLEGGRPVGRVTTVAAPGPDGDRRALAYVRTPLAVPGTALATAGGRAARVEAPPAG